MLNNGSEEKRGSVLRLVEGLARDIRLICEVLLVDVGHGDSYWCCRVSARLVAVDVVQLQGLWRGGVGFCDIVGQHRYRR